MRSDRDALRLNVTEASPTSQESNHAAGCRCSPDNPHLDALLPEMHGGALLAFADDLGGSVAGLNIPEGFRTTTIESKGNIFHACPPGRLTGVSVPFRVGRRTVVVQTSIYRSDGKLAAMMTQTQLVLPREPATVPV
jgi:uncharacterized protein (TIGR00369 family)